MSDNPASSSASAKAKLLDQGRAAIWGRHDSRRIEQVDTDWIKRFIPFPGQRHPEEIGTAEMAEFRSDLAVRGLWQPRSAL